MDVKRNRIEGWEERLHGLISGALHKPYEIGVHDCAIFAAQIYDALTGKDLSGHFKGRYKSRRESQVYISRICSAAGKEASLRNAVTIVSEIEPITPLLAQRGDVVLFIDDERVEHLGICVGRNFLVLTDSKLAIEPMTNASSCWPA